MSEIDKWYKWWATDYEKDTMLLSDNADLLYRRLLDFYWKNGGKFSEKDVSKVRRSVRFSREKWAKYWPEVSVFFVKNSHYYINRRMEKEIKKAKENHARAVENGKKGGRPKQNLQVSGGNTQNDSQNEAHASGAGAPVQQGNYIPIDNYGEENPEDGGF